MPLPGRGAKIDAAALKARIAGIRQDVHQVQPAAVSITNATEYGLAWRAGEIGEIGEIAKGKALKVDRKSGGEGKRGVVRVDLGGRRTIKKKTRRRHKNERKRK